MKVLFFDYHLPNGGTSVITLNQIEELRKRNIDTQLLLIKKNSSFSIEKNIYKKNYIHTIFKNEKKGNKLIEVIKWIKLPKKYLQFIKKLNPSIIIINAPLTYFIVFYLNKLIDKKIKIIFYHHSLSLTPKYKFSNFNKIMLWILKKIITTKNIKHIFVSNAVMKVSKNNLKIKNGVTIYNAISIPTPDTETALKNIPFQNNIILIVPGRIEKLKGQLFFLESCHEYLSKNKNINVIFAGSGSDEPLLRSCIDENQLSSQVFITGIIHNKLLLGYLEIADLIIIPSISEGFGVIILEALSLGKTILASDVGAIPEIIIDGKTGFLFKSEDSHDLVRKLNHICSNNISLNSQYLINFVKENFSIDKNIDQLIHALKT